MGQALAGRGAYAESNSFERDNPKPHVWRYRDYVIRSLNADKPYDQFLREQLAGDEMPNASAEAIIATGYYRLGAWDDEPTDRDQARYDDLDDIVTTTAQGILGMTLNCARCHDHKIDPLTQRDYYRMLAFFQGLRGMASEGPDIETQIFENTGDREHYIEEVREIEAQLPPGHGHRAKAHGTTFQALSRNGAGRWPRRSLST